MTGPELPSPDEALAKATVRVEGPGGVSGAGLLVAHDLVVSCGHVVSDALGQPREMPVPTGTYVEVAFPLSDDAEGTPRTAAVERWTPTRHDQQGDVAVLRLREPTTGRSRARPLPMADPESVWHHDATAVGFTAGDPSETWFRGTFGGPTSEGWVQVSRADGQTAFVRHGFSGSPVWDNDLGAVVGLMVAAQPEQPTQQGFVLRTRTLLREVPELAPLALPPTPFRGLAPFREGDASVFFGRDGDIEDVARALGGEQAPVTVYGPSGSGKSSLALAGVLPRMRQDGWDALVINAGQVSSPRAALATELYALARASDSPWTRTSTADDAQELLGRDGLPSPLDLRTLDVVPPGASQVIVAPYPEPDQISVYVGGRPMMHVVDLRTGKERRKHRMRFGNDFDGATHSRNGKYTVVFTAGLMVELWRTPVGERPTRVLGPIGPMQDGFVTFSGNSEFFLANGDSIRFLYPKDPGNSQFYDFESEQRFVTVSLDGRTLLRLVGEESETLDLLRLLPERWRSHLCDVVDRDLEQADRRGVPVEMPDTVCPA